MTAVRSRGRRARGSHRQPAASLLSIDLVPSERAEDTPMVAATDRMGTTETPAEAREASAPHAQEPEQAASAELRRALLEAAEELVSSETHELAEPPTDSDLVDASAASRASERDAGTEVAALSLERGEANFGEAAMTPDASQLIHGPATWQDPAAIDAEPAPAANVPSVDEADDSLIAPESPDPAPGREAAEAPETTEELDPAEELDPVADVQSGAADRAPEDEASEAPQPDAESLEAHGEAESEPFPSFADIEAYWRWLKGQRAYPSVYEVDSRAVSRRWPYSLLIYRSPGGGPLEVQKVYADAAPADAVNPFTEGQSTRISSWVLDLAQRAARRGAPLTDRQRFPMAKGSSVLVGRAVPLSDDPEDIDHVLCHVEPAA